MKNYLECLDEAAVILKDPKLTKYLKMTLSKPSVELLEKAAEIYATQSNSHKHSVSGKRPMLTEIQIVQAMAAVDEARQKLEALLAACASGAVDTVAAGEPTWRDECASAGEDCGCGAICMFAPSARKSSEGQP